MQRKKPLLAGLAIVLLIGVVSAALIEWFGRVQMTATVAQAVILDGVSYPTVINEAADVSGGEVICGCHWLQSQTSVPVNVTLNTAFNPDGDGITVSYRTLPFEVTKNSGQNDINKANGWPYIEWEIEGNNITFTFVNPTNWVFAFDYRVDGEQGFLTEYSNITITEGECAGQKIGPSYHIVTVWPHTNETVTVTACSEVWVGLRLGAEQLYFLDWIIFETEELPPVITLQPGERLDFVICYKFAVDIWPGTYTITTTVELAS